MRRGDAFVNRNEGSYPHLWIVCIDYPDGSILMFNLTSLDNAIDATCVIHEGEHPWVRWDSAVEFERAKFLDRRKVAFLEGLDVPDYQERASDKLITKILEHALRSPETAGMYKAKIEVFLNGEEADAGST